MLVLLLSLSALPLTRAQYPWMVLLSAFPFSLLSPTAHTRTHSVRFREENFLFSLRFFSGTSTIRILPYHIALQALILGSIPGTPGTGRGRRVFLERKIKILEIPIGSPDDDSRRNRLRGGGRITRHGSRNGTNPERIQERRGHREREKSVSQSVTLHCPWPRLR